MTSQQYFCPRLIDFVIIVGCKEPATPAQLLAKHLQFQQQFQRQHGGGGSGGGESLLVASPSSHMVDLGGTRAHPQLSQLPELLRRYPLDDHKDFMLPQDVTYFCQPEGCSSINCSTQQSADENRNTTSFIFTLTEKDSARVRYGVCINFFRPIEKRATAASPSPSSGPKASSKKPLPAAIDETDEDAKPAAERRRPHRRGKKASDVKYTHTLTSLCIISHHPFFTLFRECLNVLRRLIEACHRRSLVSTPASTPGGGGKQAGGSGTANRDTVWGILTGSSGTVSTEHISPLVTCEIREIETWVLRLLSAPVPVPGKTKLIVNSRSPSCSGNEEI